MKRYYVDRPEVVFVTAFVRRTVNVYCAKGSLEFFDILQLMHSATLLHGI